MSKEKDGLIKYDILQLKSLKDLDEVIKESKAQKRLKEENQLFDQFIETGKVVPLPDKPPTQAICRTTKINIGLHQQTVRKLFMPKNHKRKLRI